MDEQRQQPCQPSPSFEPLPPVPLQVMTCNLSVSFWGHIAQQRQRHIECVKQPSAAMADRLLLEPILDNIFILICLLFLSNNMCLDFFIITQLPRSLGSHHSSKSIQSPQYELLSDNEFISLSYEDRQKVTRPSSQYLFTMLAAIFMVVDIAWMFAVWSAASVGK
eukprot:scaffold9563_cov150-Skeletonema_marinoi.AAC.1